MTPRVVTESTPSSYVLHTPPVGPTQRVLPGPLKLDRLMPAPIMAGLKAIYVTGAAATTDAALAAEQALAGAQTLDQDALLDRYAEITERNRSQIRPQR